MRRSVWAAVFVAAAAALLVLHALRFRTIFQGNCPDDAYIAFRYADHLARGQGIVFNPGERVEGYSDFLWVVLLAFFARGGRDLVLPAQMLGLAAAVASVGLVAVALRSVFAVTQPVVLGSACLLIAGSGYVAAWAVGGLETALFGLLLLAAWMRWAVEIESPRFRWPLAALLFALVAMVRAEGVLIALGMALFHCIWAWRTRRFVLRAELVFPVLLLILIGVYEAWRLHYYGPHLFANSVRAKVGFGAAPWERGVPYVATRFLLPYVPLLLAVAARGLWRRAATAAGLVLLLGDLLFVAAVGGDWSRGRFFAPLLPLGIVLAVGAAHEFAPRFLRSRGARIAAGMAAAAYIGVCFHITSTLREASDWRLWTAGDAERIAIGKWLRANVPADTRIGVLAAGQIPYYSGLRTHDMLGLNDPRIAALHVPGLGRGAPGHEKFDPAYTLGEVRPDIIIGDDRLLHFRRHPLWARDYQRLEYFWKLHEVVVRRDFLSRLQPPQ
jgi:arabinofuranosyltransferase